ncbi:MAG: hypothetical protein IJQ31_10780 [Thermoguttaceae bacterium]|nr:hypothetical protein [Thermoguttaceae bacterium]
MKRVFSFLKYLAVSAFLFYATSPLSLWAAGGQEEKEAQASPWVFPYMSFVLCIFLGIMIIGMPTKRDDKPKFND